VLSLLFTRRWLGFTVLAVVLACAFVALGNWQLHRAHYHSAIAQAIKTRSQAEPVPVAELLQVGRRAAADDEWRRVRAIGHYDASHTMLLRNRTSDGQVGVEVLVPLRLGDGTGVLVDRGWLGRSGGHDTLIDVPAPPSGEVQVVGRVRPGDQLGSDAKLGLSTQPQPSISRLDPQRVASRLPYPTRGGYLEVIDESPPAATPLTPLAEPQPDSAGVNYSYAFQWVLFATVGVVGWFLLLRREAAGEDADAGPEIRPREPAAPR
jgi:cytochrome oxidase assembly protein ShyY1